MSEHQPILSNNLALPPMPVWQARSFWLQLILGANVLANAAGVDLGGALRDMGLGGSPEDVAATIERIITVVQQLSPYFLGVWLWLERRAPNYRLTFWKRQRAQPTTAITKGE